MNRRVALKSLAFYLLVPIMLYFIVSMIVGDTTDFYKGLIKPFPALPKVAFPIIWSVMYFISGLAAYFTDTAKTEEQGEEKKKYALQVFIWQLLISLLWAPIVFGFRWLLFGFFWTLLLLVLVFCTMKNFFKINKTAGYLFIPYLFWVVFLAYYTLAMYLLN